jgi:hypothetical protein
MLAPQSHRAAGGRTLTVNLKTASSPSIAFRQRVDHFVGAGEQRKQPRQNPNR